MKSDYYLLEPYYKYYNQQEIYAEVYASQADFDFQTALIDPMPIINAPRISFTYFEKDTPYLDYLLTDGSYKLITKLLISCLKDVGALFTTYPARMIGNITGKELNLDYSILHPLEVINAIDWDKSDIPTHSIKINKVILRKELIQHPKPLFRLADLGGYILIHKILKDEMIKRKITGCSYKNLDSFSSWKGFDTSSVDELIQKNHKFHGLY